MYLFKKKNINIKQVVCLKNNCIVVTKEETVILNEIQILQGIKNTDVRICGSNHFSISDIQQSFLGNFATKTIEEFNYIFSPNCFWEQGLISVENYRYDNLDNKVKGSYYLINFKESTKKMLLNDVEGAIIHVFNKNGLYKEQNILKSLSLLTGEYDWQTDLSHYRYKRTGERHEARIQQVIGVWEGQLLVWMDGNKFLSLSVETGELLWEINRWEYVEGKGHGYYFGHGVHLDETKGKCYLFEGTCYIEIDLATQKATTLWQEDIITYGRLFGRPNFTPDYIYFLIGGVCSTSVGVFDRKTLQMVWQHDFVFDQSGAEYIMLNQPPQVTDNKLYVLDTGGTLHIFERTED